MIAWVWDDWDAERWLHRVYAVVHGFSALVTLALLLSVFLAHVGGFGHRALGWGRRP